MTTIKGHDRLDDQHEPGSVQVVDRASTVRWYEFNDGIFSIHVAILKDGSEVMLRSRSDIWPSITANSLGIDYTLMRNASEVEAEKFITNEGLELLAVHEI